MPADLGALMTMSTPASGSPSQDYRVGRDVVTCGATLVVSPMSLLRLRKYGAEGAAADAEVPVLVELAVTVRILSSCSSLA